MFFFSSCTHFCMHMQGFFAFVLSLLYYWKKKVQGDQESKNRRGAGLTVIEISKWCVRCWLVFSFFIIFIFYPEGESSKRRLFLPCVVSLEQSNVIFCRAERLVRSQREWEKNKDRGSFDSETAQFDTFLWTLVGLHHFNKEASWLWKVPFVVVIHNTLCSIPPHAPCKCVGICGFGVQTERKWFHHKVCFIQPALWGLFIFKVLCREY